MNYCIKLVKSVIKELNQKSEELRNKDDSIPE